MKKTKNTYSICSLILAVISLLFNFINVGFLGILFMIVSIILIFLTFKNKQKKLFAIIAIILCIISMFLSFTWSLYNSEEASNNDKREAVISEYNNRSFTISFDTDGGTPIDSIVVTPNTDLSGILISTKKDGYDFKGWYLNGEVFNFRGYVNSRITSDVTLVAKFEKEDLPLELLSDSVRVDSLGFSYIEGTVKNKREATWGYVSISFNLYDKEGNRVGQAVDSITNFEGNGTWKFSALITEKNYYRYELAEIKNY